jgi:lipopolysaccharide/colanic/teichoic acid biosynthesis glycosyltransferase
VTSGKRAFDFTTALLGLMFLFPLFFLVALLVKFTSKGEVFYIQSRVGEGFTLFNLYKFRSMREEEGLSITSKGDPRITSVGKFIRKTKIDELPQLLNVLKGDMSLVGPRPEVEKYVYVQEEAYRKILQVKPGITDLAAIKFRDEEGILAQYEEKEKAYIEVVQPQKIALYYEYMRTISFKKDIKIILQTLKVI